MSMSKYKHKIIGNNKSKNNNINIIRRFKISKI